MGTNLARLVDPGVDCFSNLTSVNPHCSEVNPFENKMKSGFVRQYLKAYKQYHAFASASAEGHLGSRLRNPKISELEVVLASSNPRSVLPAIIFQSRNFMSRKVMLPRPHGKVQVHDEMTKTCFS